MENKKTNAVGCLFVTTKMEKKSCALFSLIHWILVAFLQCVFFLRRSVVLDFSSVAVMGSRSPNIPRSRQISKMAAISKSTSVSSGLDAKERSPRKDSMAGFSMLGVPMFPMLPSEIFSLCFFNLFSVSLLTLYRFSFFAFAFSPWFHRCLALSVKKSLFLFKFGEYLIAIAGVENEGCPFILTQTGLAPSTFSLFVSCNETRWRIERCWCFICSRASTVYFPFFECVVLLLLLPSPICRFNPQGFSSRGAHNLILGQEVKAYEKHGERYSCICACLK